MDEALAVAMPNRLRVSGEERSAEKCDEKNEQNPKCARRADQNLKWARRVVLNISADQMTGQNPFLSRKFAEQPAVLGFVRQNRILTCRTESVPGHRF